MHLLISPFIGETKNAAIDDLPNPFERDFIFHINKMHIISSHTTLTCTFCLHENERVNGREIKCARCTVKGDRDFCAGESSCRIIVVFVIHISYDLGERIHTRQNTIITFDTLFRRVLTTNRGVFFL